MSCEAKAMISVVLTVCAAATFTSLRMNSADLWNMLRPVALAAALAAVVYLPKKCKGKADQNVGIALVGVFIGVVSALQISYSSLNIYGDAKDKDASSLYDTATHETHRVDLANIVLQACTLISLIVLFFTTNSSPPPAAASAAAAPAGVLPDRNYEPNFKQARRA